MSGYLWTNEAFPGRAWAERQLGSPRYIENTWSVPVEEVHPAANAVRSSVESPTYAPEEVLERAIAQLVLLGKHAGVSADQMIQLLESGFSVGELVVYLAVLSAGRVSE